MASRYFPEGSISDIEPSYLKRSRKEIRSVTHTLGRHFSSNISGSLSEIGLNVAQKLPL